MSSERKRLPTRCQKRYARCGRPPREARAEDDVGERRARSARSARAPRPGRTPCRRPGSRRCRRRRPRSPGASPRPCRGSAGDGITVVALLVEPRRSRRCRRSSRRRRRSTCASRSSARDPLEHLADRSLLVVGRERGTRPSRPPIVLGAPAPVAGCAVACRATTIAAITPIRSPIRAPTTIELPPRARRATCPPGPSWMICVCSTLWAECKLLLRRGQRVERLPWRACAVSSCVTSASWSSARGPAASALSAAVDPLVDRLQLGRVVFRTVRYVAI